jgi:hypothetical protein
MHTCGCVPIAVRFEAIEASAEDTLTAHPVILGATGAPVDQSAGFTDLPLHSKLEQLSTPLWVFDIDSNRVVWANKSGLEVWNAGTLEELSARDLGVGMSVSVSKRLRQYQEGFEKRGAAFSELWGEPKTLRIVYSGIKLSDSRIGMFCEATPYYAETPETLRSAEALLHANVMISLYDKFVNPYIVIRPRGPTSEATTALLVLDSWIRKIIRNCEPLRNSLARDYCTRMQ